jgi:hypothetical protein
VVETPRVASCIQVGSATHFGIRSLHMLAQHDHCVYSVCMQHKGCCLTSLPRVMHGDEHADHVEFTSQYLFEPNPTLRHAHSTRLGLGVT